MYTVYARNLYGKNNIEKVTTIESREIAIDLVNLYNRESAHRDEPVLLYYFEKAET